MKGIILGSSFLLFAFFSASAINIGARTFYLSPTGDDNTPREDGSSFLTLGHAISCLAPENTLLLKNGTYEGGVFFEEVHATAESPIVIRGKSLAAAINGSGAAKHAIKLYDDSHVIIDRL